MNALRFARFDRNEIAGSLGDMGTFLPLVVAMASQNGLDLGVALLFSGLFNVATGLIFTIPLAVQPMKAIAAVALTEGLTLPQILAAGATVSLFILVLGATGLIDRVNRAVPKSVIRGIQLGLGLTLLGKGIHLATDGGTWQVYATVAIATAIVLALFASRRVPAALVLFGLGTALALWQSPSAFAALRFGPTLPRFVPLRLADAIAAFPRAALPQIPLTTLNSVVAVCALSVDLFPDRPASLRRVAVSVGLMNLVGAWFGAMPMCHGAGGLAGQVRFGARTNGSILFLGAAKIAVALIFGSSLMALCRAFPSSVLGVMLCFSGVELSLVARDQTARTDAFVMLATAGASLALNNVGIGFLLGLALATALHFTRRTEF